MRKIAMYTINESKIYRRVGLMMAAGAFLLGLTANTAAAASPVVEPAAAPTAGWTAAEAENFLLTATVVRTEPVAGVEGAARVTLSNGGRTHDALARTVEAYKYRWAAIRDSYRYNVAAYRLDKMLGAGVVPVTVERKIGRHMASVTWWADGVAAPGGGAETAAFRQLANAPVDATPNLPGAVSNGDYAQAFAPGGDLRDPERPTAINREFYERLRALDRHELASAMRSLLSKGEIESLWRRRHEILENYQPLIASAGPVIAGGRSNR